MYSVVEACLYILTIVFASHAIWERLPADYPRSKKLTFAGAFLTLFLTFFVTSISFDSLRGEMSEIKHALHLNDQLTALGRSQDSKDQAAYDMLNDLLQRSSLLMQGRETTLKEWEAIDLLSRVLKKESMSSPAELRVIAVSTDLDEFRESSPIFHYGYESQLEKIAVTGLVERTYVLGETEWKRVQKNRNLFETERPWLIPDHFQELNLETIGQHQRRSVRCYLVGRGVLPEKSEMSDYDLIVMWREQKNVVFGANRRRNGDIRILFGDRKENEDWKQVCTRMKETQGVIKVREFIEKPMVRPVDVR
jgi:hypothetical protein